ncbi:MULTISPECIES: orotidine-5'-phosphate decarboxylase [Thermodesulfovibrio]|uniref:Orotidine 5'-phosphate decarboxylase n=2 Tax=Thermodesulfovibrio yellowstonii TaxID=28262 RepID=B5YI95_THEYD|nr:MULTISPECIES: orotidine-5'-phosphate decarboxylase [Thermodesulfovibrio]ACI21077.1 orotidine 5'-phosphate decarboxylase [Thermodesulfovibrio yellowstonii DSM 11347]GLI52710.1 orotidine 5'-phosphate decarboxylase [Thermodesulfovibrio islandicus]
MTLDRVIIALDFPSKKEALKIVDELDELISFYKVGLELFLNEGKEILKTLKKREKKIFLDLKFHDIPNTVQRAVKTSLNYGVDMLTLHTTGGFEMMKRARETVEEAKIRENVSLKLLGVTVLTSLDSKSLEEIYGLTFDIPSLVKKLAMLAKKTGVDGVVASAHEISTIKEHCGRDFTVVTPGIRLGKLSHDDQKRTVTPQEAFLRGADYIVIGRAVISSQNPREVLLNLFR